MRTERLAAVIGFVFVAFVAPALSAAWTRYENARFGYRIDIPPGFSYVTEAENGDGNVSVSGDGAAELKVWGGYLVGDFKADVADRVDLERSEGWAISYDARKAGKASWSGSRGEKIFYARAVKGCDDSAAYFRIEYDRTQRETYDRIVDRLVKSLRAC